jgi:nucleoside-diphosphate-sugar epimerase
VKALLDTGKYDVWIFDVNEPTPSIPGAQVIRGNLTVPESIATACIGKHVVFHTATVAPTAQNAASAKALMQSVNVDGTRNVLSACHAAGVARLVVTSSASVVFDGTPLVNVDESKPYADPPMDYYTSTKAEVCREPSPTSARACSLRALTNTRAPGAHRCAQVQAEQIALSARMPGLAVCALRPSAIFGPGDRLTVPTVARRAQQGKMKYIIGSGKNLFDWTYVDNVTHAHVLADAALQKPGSPANGQAFFINNDEPVPFWGVMGDICEGLGYGRPYIRLPSWLMMMMAVVAVWAGRLFGVTPDLNPMRVRVCSVERTLSCAKAKKLLGFAPLVDIQTGIARTLASFPELHKDYQKASKKAD